MSSSRSMFTIIALLSVVILTVDAYDPDPLQDFCVAVNDSKAGVFVNGKFCKDPETVTPDDFFFSGLNKAGNHTSPLGVSVNNVNLENLPGLNTLGISIVRVDYAPKGVQPPHVQPRASEILHVIEGTLYAGFISSNPSNPNEKNRLYAKILRPGDVFCIPQGLIHFQYNIGDKPAVAIATQSSQNPGVFVIANAIFGSEPPVLADLLTKSFQLNKTEVNRLQSLTWIV